MKWKCASRYCLRFPFNIHYDGLFTITIWHFDQPIFDLAYDYNLCERRMDWSIHCVYWLRCFWYQSYYWNHLEHCLTNEFALQHNNKPFSKLELLTLQCWTMHDLFHQNGWRFFQPETINQFNEFLKMQYFVRSTVIPTNTIRITNKSILKWHSIVKF